MRRGPLIGLLLVLALLAYILWPVAGFYRLAVAIETKDANALARLVDFPALGKSLTKQFVNAYVEITGKRREKKQKPKLTLIERSVAINMGTAIAEPIVAELVNETMLLRLLREGRVAMPKGKQEDGTGEGSPLPLPPLGANTLNDVWEIWLHSEYRGSEVFVRLPPGKPRDEQFRARLSLAGLEWKLSGLELPEPILAKSVKEILAEQKAREEQSP